MPFPLEPCRNNSDLLKRFKQKVDGPSRKFEFGAKGTGNKKKRGQNFRLKIHSGLCELQTLQKGLISSSLVMAAKKWGGRRDLAEDAENLWRIRKRGRVRVHNLEAKSRAADYFRWLCSNTRKESKSIMRRDDEYWKKRKCCFRECFMLSQLWLDN